MKEKDSLLKSLTIVFSYFIYEIIMISILQLLGINISKLNYIQKNIYLFGIDLIYLFVIIFIYRKYLSCELNKFKNNGFNLIKKYLPFYMIGVILMGLSNSILINITGLELSANEEAIRKLLKYFPVYMTFSSVIYAPIIEELIFRKTIRSLFKNKYLFIIMSGLIFGMMHVINTGNESLNEILMGIPYVIMGLDFAYIYYKSDNIFTTITMHTSHNLILVILQFIGG